MAGSTRIPWLRDLISLEIVLWETIDTRLKQEHALSMAFFECLYVLGNADANTARVGDLAQALRITVGGASKLVDRVEAAGLLQREATPTDRRASAIVLTEAGRQALAAATATYEEALAQVLDGTLTAEEQATFHAIALRLLHPHQA